MAYLTRFSNSVSSRFKEAGYVPFLIVVALALLGRSCVGFQVTLYDYEYYKGPSRSFNVTRCVNLYNVNFNNRASSIVVPYCANLFDDTCCQGKSKRIYTSLDNLENIAFSDRLTSISPCGDFTQPAPHQIHETWAGHGQIMTKVAEGLDTVIYYNDDIKRTGIRFHSGYIRKLWAHVKKTYGEFGPESSRLFAFFHAKVPVSIYGSNSIQSYFDIQSECRNIIDMVGRDERAWSRAHTRNGSATEDLDTITHEIAHIVEWSSKGVHGSPTYQLWGDGAWAEIFTFDAYYSLGLQRERERWYAQMAYSKYDLPRRDTYWFRDWFYPIYKYYGGGKVLSRYFGKLAQHFPRKDNGWQYARDINLGEFVHFFSGAAMTDLKPFAVKAFRWDMEAEMQLLQAKNDFPGVWY